MPRDSLSRLRDDVVTCRACPRLVAHREAVARIKRRAFAGEDYWGRPVPGFGRRDARLILVGLAPGAHGSNRTGRMFTGDASGDFLYPTLHAFGFASQPDSRNRKDGLRLIDAYITAVVRCVPPGNRPSRDELRRCRPFLLRELSLLRRARVYVALGRVAFDGLWDALGALGLAPETRRPCFEHGGRVPLLDGRALIASYHPSRQNTQTGRLTRPMFDTVFRTARRLLDRGTDRSGAR